VNTVFVDTGGFFALYARTDADHAKAVDLFRQADLEHWQLVTTNAVVQETHALLLNRTRDGRTVALRFLDDLNSSGVRIEKVGADDEVAAIALIRAHTDKSYSLCDALSFIVCERAGITQAISCDDDFRSYGRLTVLL